MEHKEGDEKYTKLFKEPEVANERQVGGEHYMKYDQIQPWDMWWHWNLNPFQAMIVKHVVRYKDKAGMQDLEKAAHYLQKLIELEKVKGQK